MRPLGAPFDDSEPWEPGEIANGPDEPNRLLAEPFTVWDLLIVTGPGAGQIWLDRLADGDGLQPALDEHGERVGFGPYYCPLAPCRRKRYWMTQPPSMWIIWPVM